MLFFSHQATHNSHAFPLHRTSPRHFRSISGKSHKSSTLSFLMLKNRTKKPAQGQFSHCNRGFNRGVRIVAGQLHIIKLHLKQWFSFFEFKRRQLTWLTDQLRFHLLNVICVNVCVANCMNKLSHIKTAFIGN
jgi:hypothetical protein